MQLDPGATAERIMRGFAGLKTRLANDVREFLAARRQRVEHEREFYRKLAAYCDENNLPHIYEDDWKAAAYATADAKHPQRISKGHVS